MFHDVNFFFFILFNFLILFISTKYFISHKYFFQRMIYKLNNAYNQTIAVVIRIWRNISTYLSRLRIIINWFRDLVE